MPYFNIVAETSENTVVTEYEPVKKRSDSYQSEVNWNKNLFECYVNKDMNIYQFIQKMT